VRVVRRWDCGGDCGGGEEVPGLGRVAGVVSSGLRAMGGGPIEGGGGPSED